MFKVNTVCEALINEYVLIRGNGGKEQMQGIARIFYEKPLFSLEKSGKRVEKNLQQ